MQTQLHEGIADLAGRPQQERLIDSFQAFTELIILKVLEAHRDEEKDVSPIRERNTMMSRNLPFNR